MTTVGYARVSSTGQDLSVQLEKLAGCDKVFKEKRSGVDTGRPELKRCLEYLREGDTLLVSKIDRLARSTSDLYRIISELADKGVAFRVVDDPTIDTTSRTGKLVMGILVGSILRLRGLRLLLTLNALLSSKPSSPDGGFVLCRRPMRSLMSIHARRRGTRKLPTC